MPQGDLKVKQDEDGEERVIGVDVVLELELKIDEEEELSSSHGCIHAVKRV